MDNKQNLSYNSRIKPSLRRFLLPSLAYSAFYLFVSLLTLLMLNSQHIWRYFSSHDLAGQSLGQAIGQNAKGVQSFFSRISEGRILQILFWALIGIFIYILVWFIRNILLSVRNDIVADEYIHPHAYNRANYWHSVIGRKVFFTFSALVLVGYVYSCVKLLPLLASVCRNAISDFSWSPSIVELIGSWLAVAFLLYLLLLLGRVTAIIWRLIYQDL